MEPENAREDAAGIEMKAMVTKLISNALTSTTETFRELLSPALPSASNVSLGRLKIEKIPEEKFLHCPIDLVVGWSHWIMDWNFT